MSGLGLIYKNHLNSSDVPQVTKKAVTWIKDRILHGYYLQSNEDRQDYIFITVITLAIRLN